MPTTLGLLVLSARLNAIHQLRVDLAWIVLGMVILGWCLWAVAHPREQKPRRWHETRRAR